MKKKYRKKDALSYNEEDEQTLSEDILDFIKVFVISAVVVLLFSHFIAYPVNVKGRSMHPTLKDGEYGFTNVIGMAFHEPERFDVVVVEMEDEDTGNPERWVKRIIGMPGDTIECKDEVVYVNGQALDESAYIDAQYKQETKDSLGYFNMDFDEVKLGEDEYFLMGDNRPYSKDSRYKDVGAFTKEQIFGDGVLILFPPTHIGVH